MQRRALGLLLVVLLPATAVGYQLAQVADASGCPARLVPSPGPVRVHAFVENGAQAGALDPSALEAYLSDRFGRPFDVVAVEQADEVGFRLFAAARPFSSEVLVFLGDRASFPNVPTAHGMVDALGFATPGSACAYVSFQPRAPQRCDVAGQRALVQPAYAFLAHEVGHLLGLSHTPQGLMGKGVFALCAKDTFSAAQRMQVEAWGR